MREKEKCAVAMSIDKCIDMRVRVCKDMGMRSHVCKCRHVVGPHVRVDASADVHEDVSADVRLDVRLFTSVKT